MAKIVITNFYPIFPIVHGGQRRIYFLARELSRDHSVTLVTLDRGKQVKYFELDRNLTEIQVPAGQLYLDSERALIGSNHMLSDAAYATNWSQCRLYQGILRDQIRGSALVISEHPYSFYAIKEAKRRSSTAPILYNAQNVEVIQKAEALANRKELVPVVRSVESSIVAESAAIITCTEADRSKFISEYGIPASKITIIENGVDTSAVPLVSVERRAEFRQRLGLTNRFTAIFGGSLHFPNLAAVDAILEMAGKLPQITFIILGTICVCPALQGTLPPNVLALGYVPESDKWLAHLVSDIALNPMTLGSGSNIKMFEYAAAGLPTLSTEFGARGTGMQRDVHYCEAPLRDFVAQLGHFADGGRGKLPPIGTAAGEFSRKVADWRIIGNRYRSLVSGLVS
jgi:glycosyltransferase involved in cell wall biosynthesis